jgi:hypothetical protein
MMQYLPAGPERRPFDQHLPKHGWDMEGDHLVFFERWGPWMTEEMILAVRMGRKREDRFYGMNLDEVNAALAAWWDEQGGPPPVWACSNPMHHPSQNKPHTVVKCGGVHVWGRAVRCTEPDSFGRLLHDGPCCESRTFEQEQADMEAYAEARPHLHESNSLRDSMTPAEGIRSRWTTTKMFTTMSEEEFHKCSIQPSHVDSGGVARTMLQMLTMMVIE